MTFRVLNTKQSNSHQVFVHTACSCRLYDLENPEYLHQITFIMLHWICQCKLSSIVMILDLNTILTFALHRKFFE